jgi:D-glycero-beta-D-manno-heptose 1-phosphate adenylyltransferase
MNFGLKIIGWEQLPAWRAETRSRGQSLVVTNGCFDLLHAGHVTGLETARNLGDTLLVGLNSDNSVRQLKGPGRPVNCAADRAAVLAALESVSAVCVFEEKSAESFLRRARPDIYVKGADYTLETISQAERKVVEDGGGKIVMVPLLPGRSTSKLLASLAKQG